MSCGIVEAASLELLPQKVIVESLSKAEERQVEDFLASGHQDKFVMRRDRPEWEYEGLLVRVFNNNLKLSIYNAQDKLVAAWSSDSGDLIFNNAKKCQIGLPYRLSKCSEKFLSCDFLSCNELYVGSKPRLGCYPPTKNYLYDSVTAEACDLNFTIFDSVFLLERFYMYGVRSEELERHGPLIGVDSINWKQRRAKLSLKGSKDSYFLDLAPCLQKEGSCDVIKINSSLWKIYLLGLSKIPSGKNDPIMKYYVENLRPCLLKKDMACIKKYILGHKDLKDKKYAKHFHDKKEEFPINLIEELEACINFDSFVHGELAFKGKNKYCILNKWFEEKPGTKIYNGKMVIPKIVTFDHIMASKVVKDLDELEEVITNGKFIQTYVYIGE